MTDKQIIQWVTAKYGEAFACRVASLLDEPPSGYRTAVVSSLVREIARAA